MESQVIASNLARLRADRGLSQEKLATRAGLSRLTLGKIERGEVVPRADTLSMIARSLNVPLSDLVSPVRSISGVRFRARKRANAREQILAEVSAWLDAYNTLESDLGETREFVLRNLVGADRDPVRLASRARDLLGLRPEVLIRDVCGILEDNGVKVLLLKRSTDAFFGLSVSQRGGGPAVVVNTWERISVERWIFTAAHELGHILLHSEAYDRTREEEDSTQEREADRFASHFLMPETAFRSEWNETSGLQFIDRVLKVKRIFRVSYKTAIYRLVESDTVPADAWKWFQIQHKNRFHASLRKVDEPNRLSEGEFRLDWNRAGEPDALSRYDFVEDRLSRLVRKALEEDKLSLGRAAEILQIPRTEMRELAASWTR